MAVNTWQIPFDPSLKEVTVSLSGPSPAIEIHDPLGEVVYTFFCDSKKPDKPSLLSVRGKAVFVIHKCLSHFENQYQDFRVFFSFLVFFFKCRIFGYMHCQYLNCSQCSIFLIQRKLKSFLFVLPPSPFLLCVFACPISGHFWLSCIYKRHLRVIHDSCFLCGER